MISSAVATTSLLNIAEGSLTPEKGGDTCALAQKLECGVEFTFNGRLVWVSPARTTREEHRVFTCEH
jgi:hypothetical protein